MLRVEEVADADAFHAAADPVLSADPSGYTVIATVLADVRSQARPYPGARWFVVRDGALPVGAAMHTPPYSPYLGPMPVAAGPLVADALAESGDSMAAVAGFNGEVEVTRAAVTRWQRLFGGPPIDETVSMRLYRLDDLQTPRATGSARTATAADWDLLHDWHLAFAEEIAHPAHEIESGLRVRLERELLTVWENGDRAVAMAGRTHPAAGVVRVGPVYTPPEHRRRGYGAAVTAAASAAAQGLPETREVVLFTDLDNPTSNKIYIEVGYRPVRDYLEVTFTR
jgi:RimJ/RimL family protein N-acetyltransferase